MTAAPLAEVTRGVADGSAIVESRHAGHVVVVSAAPGKAPRVSLAHGDPARPTFARSAVKPFQATACLELLAEHAPDVAVPADELAVAWASHRGERRHLDAVERLLARSGTDPDDLTCPPALPEADTTWPPASPGVPPTRIRFNCSGKHALFALAGAAVGVRGATVVDPDGPVQRRVLGVLDEVVGPLDGHGVDGCGAPAVVVPLVGLARGFLALAVEPRWAAVRAAGFAHPGLVGGRGRIESALLAAGVIAKVGAEGVYGAGWIDDDGTAHGVAVKAEDGAVRGAAPALHAVLVARGAVAADVWTPPPVLGGGRPVGVVRPAPALVAALDGARHPVT